MREKIVRLSLSADAIDIATHEQFEAEHLRTDLVPVVRELMDDALEFLERILDTYGDTEDEEDEEGEGAVASPAGLSNFRREVDEMLVGGPAGERVGDLAFMARLELRQKVSTLTGLPPESDSWRIIAASGSCLRQLQKALAAIEASLARAEGIQPALSFNDELTLALEARRAYAGFRCELRQVERTEDLSDRLQGAATSISRLFDLAVYPNLRISDRVQLRRLLERILRWGGPNVDAEGGQRIWEDLSACASLLAEISKRQELQEYDKWACQEIPKRLAAEPVAALSLSPELRRLVESLAGRDDDFDDLIFDGREIAKSAALALAHRLAARLRRSPTTRA